jgi:hypothetical protein
MQQHRPSIKETRDQRKDVGRRLAEARQARRQALEGILTGEQRKRMQRIVEEKRSRFEDRAQQSQRERSQRKVKAGKRRHSRSPPRAQRPEAGARRIRRV